MKAKNKYALEATYWNNGSAIRLPVWKGMSERVPRWYAFLWVSLYKNWEFVRNYTKQERTDFIRFIEEKEIEELGKYDEFTR